MVNSSSAIWCGHNIWLTLSLILAVVSGGSVVSANMSGLILNPLLLSPACFPQCRRWRELMRLFSCAKSQWWPKFVSSFTSSQDLCHSKELRSAINSPPQHFSAFWHEARCALCYRLSITCHVAKLHQRRSQSFPPYLSPNSNFNFWNFVTGTISCKNTVRLHLPAQKPNRTKEGW